MTNATKWREYARNVSFTGRITNCAKVHHRVTLVGGSVHESILTSESPELSLDEKPACYLKKYITLSTVRCSWHKRSR